MQTDLPIIYGNDRRMVRLLEELYSTGNYTVFRVSGIRDVEDDSDLEWHEFIPKEDNDVNGWDFDWTYKILKKCEFNKCQMDSKVDGLQEQEHTSVENLNVCEFSKGDKKLLVVLEALQDKEFKYDL